MKLNRLAAALLAVLLCTSNLAAEQYDARPAEEAESLSAPSPDSSHATAPKEEDTRVSLPYTPYPAGLSWVLTPQAFRVPIPNRIYYPPHTYVRRCPYYPRGYYWGANWRFNVVGRGNLLFFGPFRYNPYLTAAKASHHRDLRGQKRYAPPPGPVGQAMLLGSSGPSAPVALPPTRALFASDESGASSQTATVRLAPERGPARTASSRRGSSSFATERRSE
jgi:hypothetical protein